MRSLLPLILLLGCSETGVSRLSDPDVPIDDPEPWPAILIEPMEIVFEPVQLGDRVDALFTVTNVGSAALEVRDVVLHEGPAAFSFQALDGTDLAPGQTADWSVSYRPASLVTEPERASLLVTSNDPDRIQSTVELSGSVLLPSFELTPSTHDFGLVNAGEVASADFVLRNVGDGTGDVTGLEFGATTAELALTDPGLVDAVPTTIAPGDSLVVSVDYAPVDAVRDEGTLTVLTQAPATPSLQATVQGNGVLLDRDVEIFITADDAWTGFVDGVEFTATNQRDWQRGDTIAMTLPAGKHVISIQATDVGSVISGFIGTISVDGTIVSRTGEGDWLMTATSPSSSWTDVGFDDSGWTAAVECANASTWGSYWPKPFYDEGAKWVWWTSSCRDLRQAWFRLNLDL